MPRPFIAYFLLVNIMKILTFFWKFRKSYVNPENFSGLKKKLPQAREFQKSQKLQGPRELSNNLEN